MKKINVAVIGCGPVGKKRARAIRDNWDSRLITVVDSDKRRAKDLAEEMECHWGSDWKKAIGDPSIDAVIVSTPSNLLCEMTCAALSRGKHVLVEKPMGRNLSEAGRMLKTAAKMKRKLKVGFNHRYHPAILQAHRLCQQGRIGKILNVRCQYGHGGRKGYEKEWRGNYRIAGGGELTDQGVHLIDLIQWFCGRPSQVYAALQTAYWKIRPLEDNGFAILKYRDGVVANFHSSWTQWKNLFNFEIFGSIGFVRVNGLGGSYGPETLTLGVRRHPGDVPHLNTVTFREEDESWKTEWEDFVKGLLNGSSYMGNMNEGFSVMKTLDALYRSHRSGKVVHLS